MLSVEIRNLTLEGKIIIFKSLTASEPVYIASLLPTPKCVVEAIQTIHREFIRGTKRQKLNTVIASYCDGRLKVTDIETKFQSLKFSWTTWLKNQDNFHLWKVVADKILRSVGGIEVFHANLSFSTDKMRAVTGLPRFY